jgi:hypothetical protein
MATKHSLSVTLIAFIVFTSPAFGFPEPSFYLDSCAWDATNIVVVSEGDKTDGIVEVKESWKGDLKRGDILTVPELAEFASEKSRAVRKRRFAFVDEDLDASRPTHVTGSRIILFLIKQVENREVGKTSKIRWDPANRLWKEMKVSVAWVEKGKTYAFSQQVNPGPSELIYAGYTEDRMKQRVLDILAMQDNLTKAIAEASPTKMDGAIKRVLRFDSDWTKQTAIKTLAGGGKKALPVLRNMLADESLEKYHGPVVGSLAKAGGAEIASEVATMLEQESSFWKKTGPTLKENWWNGAGLQWQDVEKLRNRYSKTLAVMQAVGEIRSDGARKTLIDFRDFWNSLPQLGELAGFDDIFERALDRLTPG